MLGVGSGGEGASGGWDPDVGGTRPLPPATLSQDERDALAVLLTVHGLGPITLARLVSRLGGAGAILTTAGRPGAVDALRDASRDADGARPMAESVAAAIVRAVGLAPSILASVTRAGVRVVVGSDDEYPSRLRQIELAPLALFVRGSLAPLERDHVVAVVGTRRPSPAGRRIASRITTGLARAGATVVSGLAVGIDGAAHAACVTEQSPTVAFIGGGHAVLFPRAHDRLADAIVDGGGAVVSEYAPHTEPTRGTFPQRNRLISGSADAVVVVEAGARSGALVTASWALEQGRECFVVPGSIEAPTSAGCNGFLRDWFGLAHPVSGIPQLLDDLGLMGAAALEPALETAPPARIRKKGTVTLPTAQAVLSGRDEAQQRVADAILRGAVTVDELVATTRLSVGAVLGALTRLESDGLVRAFHGRYEAGNALAAASPGRHRPAAA